MPKVDRTRRDQSDLPRLGKVCEKRGEDFLGELGVAGRHGQVLAPDV